ncbi:RNA helicase [Deinococcus arenae]|uniref:RNA helicase n=1 Tax=Deinococcus arenae TaxID=1452751 RepID=A0A8H9L6G7_9DEIO|nr:DEAD/DEAH box helicase [Deinococcus arenae]AWT35888.1 RNA helicase [Deinococcus actinosclerus]GGM31086.1 RNA helicase [Deinococcus arenae]
MTQHTRAPRRASSTSTASTAPAPTVRDWQTLLGDRTPTPVQAQAIPALLDGRDVITTARTGSGKTLAFLIPAAARGIGMRSTRGMQPEALVITPTRELAVQIRDVATELGMTAGRITGGITPGQTTREATGKGLITGTPGRLKDLIGRGELRLNNLRYVVLDEADELLSLGFLRDVGDILRHARDQQPQGRTLQIAMASATFPAEIRDVAQRFMHDPARIDVAPTPGADATGDILGGVSTATHLLHHTTKDALLTDAARHTRAALKEPGGCVVLFSRTKHLVKRRAQHLGDLLPGEQVSPLEGNMDQKKRERTMQALRDGQSRILVATDIAGRGIDLPEVRLVIHLDVAATAEDHVHRSGRTARAGRDGTNLILLAPEQRALWQGIRRKLPAALQPPATPEERQIDPEVQEKRGQGRGQGQSQGRGGQPGRGAGQQPRSAQGGSQGQRQGTPRQGQQGGGRSEGRPQRSEGRPQQRQDTPGTGAGRVGPQRPKRRR